MYLFYLTKPTKLMKLSWLFTIVQIPLLKKVKAISDPRIIIDDYQGPTGIVTARIQGITLATGDIILCIDGDAFAQDNWIEIMSSKLNNPSVSLVGSTVVFFWNIILDNCITS
jgi:glycosyltransferase involved in cell wall biosynthesis